MIRVMQLTDLHVRPNDTEAPRILGEAVRLAASAKVSLTVITGDFAGMAVPYRPPATVLDLLASTVRALSEISPVVLLIGNHDHEPSIQLLRHAAAMHDVYVVAGAEQITIFTRDGAVDVYALAYPKRGFAQLANLDGDGDTDASAALSSLMRAHALGMDHDENARPAARLGIGHFLAEGSTTGHGEILKGREPTVSIETLDAWGVDFALLGHLHKAQPVGDRSSYGGSAWATDYGDLGDKSITIVDIDPTGDLIIGDLYMAADRRIPATGNAHAVNLYRIPTSASPVLTLDYRWGERDGVVGWLDDDPIADLADGDLALGTRVKLRITRQAHVATSCPMIETAAAFAAAGATVETEPKLETSIRSRPAIEGEESRSPAERFAAWVSTQSDPPSEAMVALTQQMIEETEGSTLAEMVKETQTIAASDSRSAEA